MFTLNEVIYFNMRTYMKIFFFGNSLESTALLEKDFSGERTERKLLST